MNESACRTQGNRLPAITIKSLKKSYGEVKAVDDISFEVEDREIFGAAAFLSLGFLIASLTRSLKTAQMASNAISFPMMFLSRVFFPLAILPAFLAKSPGCFRFTTWGTP